MLQDGHSQADPHLQMEPSEDPQHPWIFLGLAEVGFGTIVTGAEVFLEQQDIFCYFWIKKKDAGCGSAQDPFANI